MKKAKISEIIILVIAFLLISLVIYFKTHNITVFIISGIISAAFFLTMFFADKIKILEKWDLFIYPVFLFAYCYYIHYSLKINNSYIFALGASGGFAIRRFKELTVRKRIIYIVYILAIIIVSIFSGSF